VTTAELVAPSRKRYLICSTVGVAIDRRTQNADVLARVLALDAPASGDDVRTEVIDLAVHPSLRDCHEAVAAVELTVGGVPPRRPELKRRR
jgi:hypothetical protein